jgi:hypothetical protein
MGDVPVSDIDRKALSQKTTRAATAHRKATAKAVREVAKATSHYASLAWLYTRTFVAGK